MTLKNFLRALGRRWYVVLVGLVITGVGCGAVWSAVHPTYQRTASLLLMPAASSVPEGGNAYLFLGGLGQASEVLVNTMAAQTVREPLLDGHPGADVRVERNVTSSGPLLTVTATGSGDTEVSEVLDRALAAVQSNLSTLQTRAQVPDDARISSLSLTTDQTSTLLQRSRLEAVAGTAAAGVALTLLLTGLVDGLILSSTRKRRPAAPDSDADIGAVADPERLSTTADLDLDLGPDADADVSAPAKHAVRRKPVPVFAGGPAADAGADRTDEEYAQDLDDFGRGAGSLERGARATEHVE